MSSKEEEKLKHLTLFLKAISDPGTTMSIVLVILIVGFMFQGPVSPRISSHEQEALEQLSKEVKLLSKKVDEIYLIVDKAHPRVFVPK